MCSNSKFGFYPVLAGSMVFLSLEVTARQRTFLVGWLFMADLATPDDESVFSR
jgi:hypothetical protein